MIQGLASGVARTIGWPSALAKTCLARFVDIAHRTVVSLPICRPLPWGHRNAKESGLLRQKPWGTRRRHLNSTLSRRSP